MRVCADAFYFMAYTVCCCSRAVLKPQADKDVRGFVLASSGKSVFSAGLDITEMHRPDGERLGHFWRQLQETWLTLYGTGLATVAAIDGHAPAGGCLLVRTDARVCYVRGQCM
jgi:3,2-trans-enoyl-CoA isomerase